MAERSSDRHRGKRIYGSGAEKRKRAKKVKDKNLALIEKTSRMTGFLKVREAEASPAFPEGPDVLNLGEPMISDESDTNSDCDIDTSQSQLPDFVQKEVEHLRQQTQHWDANDKQGERGNSQDENSVQNNLPQPSHDQSFSGTGDPINDIGMWPSVLDKEFADLWIRNGTQQLQNCDEKLFQQCSLMPTETTGEKKSHRKCSLNMFERRNRNGEVVKRSWLCFSPLNGKLYCVACRLKSSSKNQLSHDGYCDWRHASFRLAEHERSKDHIEAVVGLARRAKELGIIE